MQTPSFTFYEFFAGGGMARAGLGPGWRCLFANDVDPKKGFAYRANWGGGDELRIADIGALDAADLPGRADLVWGSFPCQDLSLAGAGAGLKGARSGTFYPFWKLIDALAAQGRAPALVAVENVCGALTSRGGRDFAAICRTFDAAGYRCGALVIDAALFVPQSRPRLFVIGVRRDLPIDPALLDGTAEPAGLQRAVSGLPAALREAHLRWSLPQPARRNTALSDLVEAAPHGVAWHAPAATARLLALMNETHRAKVAAAQAGGRRMIGSVYRRTRLDADGVKRQRAEVRFDDVAGCLRTPAGGSSRQTLLVVEGARIRSRLLSPREAARLMGLDDTYRLPTGCHDALHLLGDGVVAPVVRHLAHHLFEPLLRAGASARRAA